ncbi:hypothetical protein SAMN05428944_3469 [Streptomyces sp. 1222.5]|uniref:hypothetical protein n=1 Tax=unclassified Streptomyces TaxID=2593676 RepID=UPI000897DBF4|nr:MULTISPECIES: hypothetical protein [unclassified Streptomyces]PKW09375.1 hypothetical protein BX260_4624 [Streptomyces sp. 5112.2]SEC36921.1 hypothetical protein SAMN05428944_3469 [Streptomyces sp. 1222.5]SED54265.1 hypothetical protein SAMN05216532_4881 [Streptomyces sp. 2231.1]
MEQTSRAGLNLNWLLPAVYGVAVALTAVFGSGKAVTAVAVIGGVLIGLYYGFGRRRGARG